MCRFFGSIVCSPVDIKLLHRLLSFSYTHSLISFVSISVANLLSSRINFLNALFLFSLSVSTASATVGFFFFFAQMHAVYRLFHFFFWSFPLSLILWPFVIWLTLYVYFLYTQCLYIYICVCTKFVCTYYL